MRIMAELSTVLCKKKTVIGVLIFDRTIICYSFKTDAILIRGTIHILFVEMCCLVENATNSMAHREVFYLSQKSYSPNSDMVTIFFFRKAQSFDILV